MCHGNQITRRRCHQIDLRIHILQILFQNDHAKTRRPSRNIAGSLCNCIGCDHAGSCIAFRRAERNSCLQFARNVQKLCALFSQNARLLARLQILREYIGHLPGISLVRDQCIEFIHHRCIIIPCLHADREHSGAVADADHLLAGQLPVNIGRQRCHKMNVLYVILAVQDRLIQMRNAPSLRNIVVEQLRQLFCCLAGNGVAPGAERYQQLILVVKRQIAVHHGTDANGRQTMDGNAVFILHISPKIRIASLQSCPNIVQ